MGNMPCPYAWPDQTFIALLGVPLQYIGEDVTSVALRLPGDTQSIAPQSDLLSIAFVFQNSDLFDLVGSLHGNVTVEPTGMVGACRFTTQETIKIVGPKPK